MKYIIIILVTVLTFSCKPCRECKYATFKGSEIGSSCSSIKGDLDAFEARWDSLATAAGSEAICTKKRY